MGIQHCDIEPPRPPPADMLDVEGPLLGIAEDRRYRAIGVLIWLALLVCGAIRLGPVAAEALADQIAQSAAALYGSGQRDELAIQRASAVDAADPDSPAGRGLVGIEFWGELVRLESS